MAEALGLHYVNVPLKPEALSEELVHKILMHLEQIPKPAVMHYAANIRSAVIALLSVAIQDRLTPEQTLAKARNLGFEFVNYACVNPQLKESFIQYVNKYTKVAVTPD